MTASSSLFAQLRVLRGFLDRTGVRISALALPVLLAFFASLAEAASVSLLIPFLKGIMDGDFRFLNDTPIIQSIVQLLPENFAKANANLIAMLVVLIFATSVSKTILNYFSQLLTSNLVQRFSNNLRKHVFDRFLQFGKLYFDKHSSGYLQGVLTAYVDAIGGALRSLQVSLYALFTLAAYLTIMCFISWKLTLVVLGIFPALRYSLASVIHRLEKTSRDYAQSINNLSRQISNTLSSIPLVKACCSERVEREKFGRLSDHVRSLQFSLDKKNLLVSPVHELVALIFLLALVGLIGFFVMLDGSAKLAHYAVFVIILRRASVMFGVFNNLRAALATVSGPMHEVLQLFNDDNKYYVVSGTRDFPEFRDRIQVKALDYRYPDGVAALHDLSFEIERGKMTAIVGHTGAGKSTVVSLFMRYYDAPPGTILVDGVDLREFSVATWLRHIALVSQEAFLFHAPLRENILYGTERTVSDDELRRVLEQARLTEFIEELPSGLATEIGDRGVKLSGGEKQRVSIARALLRNADILILDEATSALDSKTERLVQDALNDLIQGKTTIVIAHRLSTIKHADKILVLEGGTIIEQGPLDALLSKKGRFFEYWDEQRFASS